MHQIYVCIFLLEKNVTFAKKLTISLESKIKRKEKKKSQIQVQLYYIAASFQWKNDENYPFFTSQLVELYTILLAQREQLTPQIAQKKNGRSRSAVPEKNPRKMSGVLRSRSCIDLFLCTTIYLVKKTSQT